MNLIIIYDTHELETEKNNFTYFRRKLSKIVERCFINFTDRIIVVGEAIADEYKNMYTNIDRPFVVKNATKFIESKKTNYFRRNFSIQDDAMILLYQGGLTSGRGVEILLDAFKKRNDGKVVIVFMGNGQFEGEIKRAAKECNNIFFHPVVPPDVVLEYTSSADVGVSLIQNTCLSYYYCLPNKLFEYAMAGLPVIVSNMKEMRNLVESYSMGIVVEDFNVESLNHAIDCILGADLCELKKNTRRFAGENTWEEQEKILSNIYAGIS